MTKVLTCLILSLALAFAVYADVGPTAPAPEDVSIGSCDPILGNWQTDLVAWTQMPNANATFRRAASGFLGWDWWYCFGDQYLHTA
jgi:hypothetical protein